MTNVEFLRIIFASVVLVLLMLSSSGFVFATGFMAGFYILLGTLIFLGIVLRMADFPVVKSKETTSKTSTFMIQMIHVVAVSHLYMVGYTTVTLPILTLISIAVFANLIKKVE